MTINRSNGPLGGTPIRDYQRRRARTEAGGEGSER